MSLKPLQKKGKHSKLFYEDSTTPTTNPDREERASKLAGCRSISLMNRNAEFLNEILASNYIPEMYQKHLSIQAVTTN